MLRSILVGLDGSAYSEVAVELGTRWARRFDALLVGLGIVDEPTICKPESTPIGAGGYKVERDQSVLADARRRVGEFIEEFARRCEEGSVKYQVLESVGAPDRQIEQESRMHDLTMLGRQTYFHFETQDWPDETLRKVLRHVSRPVVTVPEVLGEGTAVVVAYDGSPQADRALQAFQALGMAGEDEVHVVSIDDEQATAARLAKQAVEYLQLRSVKATGHPLEATQAASDLILAQVRQLQARLLVMGAYGRSMLQELAFGSTTTSVLEASPVPLFLCH